MTDWIADNFLELFGALTGLIYLYFSYRKLIWLWPFGIITSSLYIFVCFRSGFYADMSLQIYYVAVSIYGWWFWIKGQNPGPEQHAEVPVTRLNLSGWLWSVGISLLLTYLIFLLLNNFTDSTVPLGDAFTTAFSIVATWLLARKILENWLFWIVIDLVSLALYIYKGLYPTSILFLIYTIIALAGYFQWKNESNGHS